MGWLFQHDKLTHQTPAEYIAEHYTAETAEYKATVLVTATVGGTIYAAIRNEIKSTGDDYTFCGVFLFKNNQKEGFGYKSMDETIGPCEVDCPDRIMRLLSPVETIPESSYAAKWRADVASAREMRKAARKQASRFQMGDIIRLPRPIQFSKFGISTDSFVLIEYRKRRPVFAPESSPWFLWGLSRCALTTAVIERPAT